MNGLYDEIRVAIHAIWTRRWLALAVAWAIAIVGWLFVSQIPNSYESRARVFVQMQTILPNAVGISPAEQQKDIDTIRQTLTSAVNLEKVVRGTDLANSVSSAADVSDRVAGLQKAIKITAQQDNLFEVVVTGSSPKVARQVVQKLIDIFVEQNLAGNRAKLVRYDRNTGKQREYNIKLSSLLKNGDSSANVRLEPGDVIIIPESMF